MSATFGSSLGGSGRFGKIYLDAQSQQSASNADFVMPDSAGDADINAFLKINEESDRDTKKFGKARLRNDI